MFKDDRMMSMLTFVLVMLVVGTMIQRVDVFSQLFGDGPDKLELRSDEVIVRANELTPIDVLENDLGVTSSERAQLAITAQPACGRVFVREGMAHYLPAERCAGPQSFRYTISGYEGPPAEVIAVVQLDDPAKSRVAPNAQRDIATPTPGATRPAVPRGAGDPSVLAQQTEGAASVSAAPSVPRPQAGQAAGLAAPSGATAQDGGAALALGGAGSTPRIADPGASPEPGAPLPGTAALPLSPLQSVVPAPGTGTASTSPGAPEAGPGAAATLAGSDPAAGNRDSAAGTDIQLPGEAPGLRVTRTAPAGIDSSGAGGGITDQPSAALQGLLQAPAPAPSSPAASAPSAPAPAAMSPPALADPLSGGVAATDPAQPLSASPDTPPFAQPAAPPAPAEPCTVPPALTVEIRPGGQTVVSVEAPCDASHVARLGYDALEFGIALDAAGKGSATVPGLQPSSNAELRLPSGDGLAFDLPFADTGRMDRVALVWEAPVRLDLHAFEFGALPGSAGHVSPDQPRSFDMVRRHGGGFLLSYVPVGGVGQNISVYSFWRRPGGGSGVVKLMVDFASREGAGEPDTCGTGAQARPDFRVLRTQGGRVAPPGLRRLAALDCGAVAQADRLIGDAVDDMLVLRK